MIVGSCPAKSSKELQRRECDGIGAFPGTMVLSSLSETEVAEAFAWDLGNLEVPNYAKAVQVAVVVSTINLHPRGPVV